MSSSFWCIHSDAAFQPYKWSQLANREKTLATTILYRHHTHLTPLQHEMDLSPVLFVVNTPGPTESEKIDT